MALPSKSPATLLAPGALLFAVACGSGGGSGNGSGGGAPPPKPSLVLVLTDDQDVQLGSLDYMPKVKALLTDVGLNFTNHYVPLSLCCPSRTTILRGQFPHNSDIRTNSLPLGGFEKVYADQLETATLATTLHGAGYRTALMGKYLNGYPDTASPTYVPPGWDEWYSPSAGNPYSEYNYTLNENGRPKVYGRAAADYLTDVLAAKAVDFLQRTAPGQPLFLYFATYAPHAPYTPAPRHAGLFPDVKAPRPPSFNEADVADKPAYIATRPLLTAAQIAGIDEDYRNRIRSLQAVDEAVSAILSILSSTGRLANTYVVYSSDNGYHMGEHRLLPGKYTPYETDLHVPMIVRGPGVPAGQVRTQLTANVDLAQTFTELAGAASLPFADGRSLVPLLGPDPPSTWRQAFLLEEFNTGVFVLPGTMERTDPASPLGVREPPDAGDLAAAVAPMPSYYGFQAPAYKYVEYETGEKELYLASDPHELHNAWSGLSAGLKAALAAYVRTLQGCKGETCRSADAVAPPALAGAAVSKPLQAGVKPPR